MKAIFFVGSHYTGKTSTLKLLSKKFQNIREVDGVARQLSFIQDPLVWQHSIFSKYINELIKLPLSSVVCATCNCMRFLGYAVAHNLPEWYLQLLRSVAAFEFSISIRVFYFPIEVSPPEDMDSKFRIRVDHCIRDELNRLQIPYTTLKGSISQKADYIFEELKLWHDVLGVRCT